MRGEAFSGCTKVTGPLQRPSAWVLLSRMDPIMADEAAEVRLLSLSIRRGLRAKAVMQT